ncbi:response regulator [Paenibacillus psychroresistens]|uniref:Response regulator n=1 Tax=Paenibacillus psychroresistens TaxID=1778678 RepID=A0A6B8REG3_9BACL|nr:response regulator [Paenibacillus psychroresistens]QGQ93935.1 response regulator [Paenibacillus psychroresistens]
MYNVMIVDDESVIKKGLLNFINWESLGCKVICDASNGFEALEHLTTHSIDIIITDIKMPGMDGIELAKNVYERFPHIRIIILTAYADFSYAQSAIKYNVVDFVIKTNPTEKIPAAVSKAKELIIQQQKIEKTIHDNLSEIREKVIGDILNGILITPEIIKNKLEETGVQPQNYYIVAFEINQLLENGPSATSQNQHEFLLSIKSFLSLAFIDYDHFSFTMQKNLFIVLVSFTSDNPAVCLPSLLLACNEVLDMVVSFMNFKVSIGISTMQKSALELSQAYKEARAALLGSFYNDNSISIYTANALTQTNQVSINYHLYADEIVSHLQHGNPDKAISLLLKLFEEYKLKQMPINHVIVYSMLLCSQCFRLLSNYKLVLPFDLESEAVVYRQIQDSKSIQSISNILENIVNSTSKLITANRKQYNYLVMEVNKYIEENYNNEINLMSIANYVHVNSSYLSRLYKKETGETVIDTLNKYKIEIAKKLLKDPSKKIFEVAADVGIGDPAYFTHVFIKYTGISPKEFKAIHIKPL